MRGQGKSARIDTEREMRRQMQNIVLRDLSILWAMVHVIFLFVMLFRSRYTRRKTILFAVSGMGILMVLNLVVGWMFGLGFLGKIFFVTCSIPSFVFFYMISADKKFRFLFTFCLADTTCLWLMAVTNLLDYYLGGGNYILMFCISVSRVSGIPFFAKTISGAAGYSGEGMGSFFRNDNIVLCSSSTCGSVPGQYCGETRGYPGLCIDLDFDVI